MWMCDVRRVNEDLWHTFDRSCRGTWRTTVVWLGTRCVRSQAPSWHPTSHWAPASRASATSSPTCLASGCVKWPTSGLASCGATRWGNFLKPSWQKSIYVWKIRYFSPRYFVHFYPNTLVTQALNWCRQCWDQQQQQQQWPFNGFWSGTTLVGRYQKKHSPTHTHLDHRASFITFITFLHLQRSMASSLFNFIHQ